MELIGDPDEGLELSAWVQEQTGPGGRGPGSRHAEDLPRSAGGKKS